ncbi:hypothetical protein RhiirA4_439703 [Rhizophagus irregularis]|uniref:Uncharacterized protein n=1 Tax=Rhizophagus irregularis TaxID=588596 RepID=A0A2I1FX53_9GLOM|nr:hypothetical protein RhiirA4_439703 [Rhizophagus irregularis]
MQSDHHSTTTKKEDYQIEICQDGKFAVTFDTGNLRIKILENTDHRQFDDKNKDESNETDESDEIVKTIAYFKINDDFDIDKFYDIDYTPPPFVEPLDSSNSKDDDKFRWSFDISNMYKKSDNKYFVLVAVSRINVVEDMKGGNNEDNYEKKHLSKKKFKCELEDKDIKFDKFDATIDIEEHKSEELDDRTSELKNETKKGIAIYRLEFVEKENYVLKAVTRHYSNEISGICSFVEEAPVEDEKEKDKDEDKNELKKFIILNYRGIYNFKFNDHFDNFNLDEKFKYPQSIRRELDSWYTGNTAKTDNDCMKRLLSCIYNKYFLVTQYTNNVQSLEVYDLEKMTLETTAKSVENKDKFINQYYYDTFSVGKIQLCFTRGINNVKLYYMENGLQIISKKFDEIEKIHLLEFIDSDEKILIIGEEKKELKFIVWDLYSTGKVEKLDNFSTTIKNLSTCLARTSGNILQINNDGKVSSVLKKVENELKKTKKDKKLYHKEGIISKKHKKQSHIIHYDKNKNEDFEPIVDDKELWVLGDYERNSYCLYQNKEGSETLQLIVGRTTVQIWHQIKDDSKNKDELPNKGEPFLEYIWTNRIPVNQESEETRLQIENFEYGTNDESHDKLIDFSLTVYWYIRVDKEENVKKGENDIIKEDNEKINEMEKIEKMEKTDEMEEKKMKESGNMQKWKKTIKRKFITKKSYAVRHACKALEHLNKLYKNKNLASNYIVTHEVG